MTPPPRIVVTVSADGQISAETEGLLGDACLDYIAVLEDLLAARADVRTVETQHDVERA